MRVTNWLKAVPTLVVIGTVLFLVLSVGSGLLLWGSNFAHNMVHDQLVEQKIQFPPAGSPGLDPKEFPGLQRYAGQTVDNGARAKAYADQFIKVHLAGVANGQTYSQVSAASLADPTNAELQGKAQTLFRGETLRGLLLYAWGWSVVGEIALWVGYAALLGAIAVLLALLAGFLAHERQARHRTTPPEPGRHRRPSTGSRRLSQSSRRCARTHLQFADSARGPTDEPIQRARPRDHRRGGRKLRPHRDDVRVLRLRGRCARRQPEHGRCKAFDLTAGTYAAFCNIIDAGQVHFSEGMHVTFTVS